MGYKTVFESYFAFEVQIFGISLLYSLQFINLNQYCLWFITFLIILSGFSIAPFPLTPQARTLTIGKITWKPLLMSIFICFYVIG